MIPQSQAAPHQADYVGCYDSISGGVSQGDYQWQTSGHCRDSCPGYDYVAVQGQKCVCLNEIPDKKVDDDECNVTCPGYGDYTCGGDGGLYTVFQGAIFDGNMTNPDSELSSSKSTTKKSSITASPTSKTDDDDDNKTVLTSSHTTNGSVLVVTVTTDAPTETGDSDEDGDRNGDGNNDNGDNKSSNVGPIVGGIIGGVAGALIIGALVFFWVKKRRSDDDEYDEEDFFDTKPLNRNVGGSRRVKPGPLDMPLANPFVDPASGPSRSNTHHGFVDPRVNPIMMGGRRRLSEGSFVDEANFPRKPLQVANPDD